LKEITFLKQNYERWQQFEDLLNSKLGNNPDALADLFIRITDDLSWARTFYPGSNTEKYLNDLAARIHQEIYKNKKEKRSRLFTFWTHEVPLLMAKNRLNLLIAFLIFAVSTWIGIISARHDPGFVRIILGDQYVDMTLENMAQGDPLGVYKQDNQFVMFLFIAINNSRVALLCILAGLAGWLGVGFLQFKNGVMLGAFFTFLVDHGFAHEAMMTVWVHGTIEISCIVIAGAAGMALGNGLWFPGAWPRGVSFMRGGREALKIGIGLIPFFFLAAFFEGFVTRFTGIGDAFRMAIIIGSMVLIAWYFILLPFFLERKKENAGFVLLGDIPLLGKIFRLLGMGDRWFTTRFAFQLMLGLLLIGLPVIAIAMQVVLEKRADFATLGFFGICILGGIASITLAFIRGRQIEEEELEIGRRKNKTAEYDRQATSVKI
jgi:uncharacterized membrane protein SpoIIM required for sporulation